MVAMFDAALDEAGLELASNSAYRSYSAQENVYDGDDLTTARPGFSEHQTGLTIDIGAAVGGVLARRVLRRHARGRLAARQRLAVRVHPALPGRQDRHHRLHVRAVALPLRRHRARHRDARDRRRPRSRSSSGCRPPPTTAEPMARSSANGCRARGFSLAVLIVNQLLAGVGVATGMALAAILTADLTGVARDGRTRPVVERARRGDRRGAARAPRGAIGPPRRARHGLRAWRASAPCS